MLDRTPYTPAQLEWLSRVVPATSDIWQVGRLDGVELRAEADGRFALYIDGLCYMTSNNPDLLDHLPILIEAHGHVLLTGLGMGLGLLYADLNKRIESVTVVELDPRVIELISPMVLPSLKQPPKIINADANTLKPLTQYDWVFLDHAHARVDADAVDRYAADIADVCVWWDVRKDLESSWQ